jgi:hypothetical protein
MAGKDLQRTMNRTDDDDTKLKNKRRMRYAGISSHSFFSLSKISNGWQRGRPNQGRLISRSLPEAPGRVITASKSPLSQKQSFNQVEIIRELMMCSIDRENNIDHCFLPLAPAHTFTFCE